MDYKWIIVYFSATLLAAFIIYLFYKQYKEAETAQRMKLIYCFVGIAVLSVAVFAAVRYSPLSEILGLGQQNESAPSQEAWEDLIKQ